MSGKIYDMTGNAAIRAAHAEAADAEERRRDAGRGRLPRRMLKPMIYFAGRMDGSHNGDDWRDAIDGFDGLRSHCDGNADCDAAIDCGLYWYGGPFVLDNAGGHTSGHAGDGDPDEHREIWRARSCKSCRRPQLNHK
jgi:hypothetical protein